MKAREEVREAIAWACRHLGEQGIEAPRLTAELLLAHVLGWDRIRIVSHGEEKLPPDAAREFRALVERRSRGEPLQYLSGEREFYGLSFKVNASVLIPRPETEILVEQALQWAHSGGWDTGARFVDVGTGSGCIAVALASRQPGSCGWAVDISTAALAVARFNAIRHGVEARIGLVCADLLTCFAPAPAFPLILANLPYIPCSESGDLAPMVRDYEPPGALFAGESGLEAYRRLIPQAAARLGPGGRIILEAGAGQAPALAGMLEAEGLPVVDVVQDLQGIARCLVAVKNLKG